MTLFAWFEDEADSANSVLGQGFPGCYGRAGKKVRSHDSHASEFGCLPRNGLHRNKGERILIPRILLINTNKPNSSWESHKTFLRS